MGAALSELGRDMQVLCAQLEHTAEGMRTQPYVGIVWEW